MPEYWFRWLVSSFARIATSFSLLPLFPFISITLVLFFYELTLLCVNFTFHNTKSTWSRSHRFLLYNSTAVTMFYFKPIPPPSHPSIATIPDLTSPWTYHRLLSSTLNMITRKLPYQMQNTQLSTQQHPICVAQVQGHVSKYMRQQLDGPQF